jgi:hypothetical protein
MKIKQILKISEDVRELNSNENEKLFGNLNEDADVEKINQMIKNREESNKMITQK